MYRKLIGILVCLLLVATALPVIGVPTKDKNEILGWDAPDQSQIWDFEKYIIPDGSWQHFVPQDEIQSKIYVKIAKGRMPNNDITLSIERPQGVVYTSVTVNKSLVPYNETEYVLFDFENVKLPTGIPYLMVLSGFGNDIYYWGGSWNDPYKNGVSSRDPDWDFCFNTYVEISRDKAINKPILNWLQSHPNMFPILQQILVLFGL